MRFNPFVPHGPEPFAPTPRSGGPVPSVIEFFKRKIDELFRRDSASVHYTPEEKTNGEKTVARGNIGAQEKLVSGVNLKTVGGRSLLGGGDVPVPDTEGRLPVKHLPAYLHALDFDDTYIADARAWYASHADGVGGGCSAVRNGMVLGRNYDWKYSEAAEFVVRESAVGGRHASVGVASLGAELTERMVCSGEYTRLYRVLPGMTLDGINDAGVVAEINVIPRDPTKDPVRSETRDLHAFEVVRHVLDNYATAQSAAEYVAAHYYIPEGGDSFHWMIADADGTYIVEDGGVITTSTTMTNYRIGVSDDPYGTGYARRTVLGGGGTVAELLASVRFTNAYADGWPWADEFAAPGVGAHDQTDALKAWAEAHVTPHLDPVTRKPAVRDGTLWQTVHSSVYDLSAKTLSLAVQEDFSTRFVFAVDVKTTSEYQRKGDDEYYKSYVANGVQHYVKMVMVHDEDIGWGAEWTGDYILVGGEFIPYTEA